MLVPLEAGKKGDKSPGHCAPQRTLKPGETLDLGKWKPL
jgi:hypothetical protein